MLRQYGRVKNGYTTLTINECNQLENEAYILSVTLINLHYMVHSQEHQCYYTEELHKQGRLG